MLGGVAANSKRSFDELMQGVANRIEKLPLDDRLATLFNHVPRSDDDPRFDLRDVLDEDCVVIIDTGGLRTESQRVLALVLSSNRWTALRRRAADRPDGGAPLVNLYLEEAATLATTDLVSDLLSQSRAFGLSVTLAMQFPAQLRTSRHLPTSHGLIDAVECCSTMDRVDRDDVPICDVPLTLTPDERAQSDYSDRQFAFLQAVCAALNGHCDAPHYELGEDSMLRLQEYVGVDADAVQELLDDGRQRVAKTYSDATPPVQFAIDTDGFTDVRTHRDVRRASSD